VLLSHKCLKLQGVYECLHTRLFVLVDTGLKGFFAFHACFSPYFATWK